MCAASCQHNCSVVHVLICSHEDNYRMVIVMLLGQWGMTLKGSVQLDYLLTITVECCFSDNGLYQSSLIASLLLMLVLTSLLCKMSLRKYHSLFIDSCLSWCVTSIILFHVDHPATDGVSFRQHRSPKWQWLCHTSYQHSKPTKGLQPTCTFTGCVRPPLDKPSRTSLIFRCPIHHY